MGGDSLKFRLNANENELDSTHKNGRTGQGGTQYLKSTNRIN